MLVTLPLLVYYLWLCLADNRGALIVPTTTAAWGQLLGRVPAPTPTAAAIVLGWLLLQGLLYLYAPGKLVNGMPLADGSRLPYKVNGWSSWWLTWAALASLVWMGWIPPGSAAITRPARRPSPARLGGHQPPGSAPAFAKRLVTATAESRRGVSS